MKFSEFDFTRFAGLSKFFDEFFGFFAAATLAILFGAMIAQGAFADTGSCSNSDGSIRYEIKVEKTGTPPVEVRTDTLYVGDLKFQKETGKTPAPTANDTLNVDFVEKLTIRSEQRTNELELTSVVFGSFTVGKSGAAATENYSDYLICQDIVTNP